MVTIIRMDTHPLVVVIDAIEQLLCCTARLQLLLVYNLDRPAVQDSIELLDNASLSMLISTDMQRGALEAHCSVSFAPA